MAGSSGRSQPACRCWPPRTFHCCSTPAPPGRRWSSAVVALALWCMIGVGLGSVLPNQVGAIIAILAFTQFVEPIVRLGLSAFDATAPIARFLPGAAAEAIAGSSFYTAGSATGCSDDCLGRW
ncbi:hypothetical protein [Aeromicrobium sp. UC242_57]|uniref:hypothetical protein n=1 Tax=Aeromicrobium sp. UC242_57 TaxID=3374624 RepID=UPI00378904A9